MAAVDGGIRDSGTIIIGLGNPGKRFECTPHNVGRRTLDLLAESLGAVWLQDQEALVARVQVGDRLCLLVKPQSAMNDIGPVLLRMSRHIRFAPANCVIIQDDVHLTLGTVRQAHEWQAPVAIRECNH